MKKNKKGFTLVELLAVIVIMGVLLLVAVPAVSNTIQTAKRNSAKNESINVLNAMYNCSMTTDTLCSKADVAGYIENIGTLTTLDSTGTADSIKITKLEYKTKEGYTIKVVLGGSFTAGVPLNTLKNKIKSAVFTSGTSKTITCTSATVCS